MGFIARLERTTGGKIAIGLSIIAVALVLAPLLAGPTAALHALNVAMHDTTIGEEIGRSAVDNPLVTLAVLGAVGAIAWHRSRRPTT
jgi:hypothetical protein